MDETIIKLNKIGSCITVSFWCTLSRVAKLYSSRILSCLYSYSSFMLSFHFLHHHSFQAFQWLPRIIFCYFLNFNFCDFLPKNLLCFKIVCLSVLNFFDIFVHFKCEYRSSFPFFK